MVKNNPIVRAFIRLAQIIATAIAFALMYEPINSWMDNFFTSNVGRFVIGMFVWVIIYFLFKVEEKVKNR